jgi:hypothetical protein
VSIALAAVENDLIVPVFIPLDCSAAPVIPDALEVDPNRNDYHVAEGYNRSIYRVKQLKIGSRYVDQNTGDCYQKIVKELFETQFGVKVDLENLEEANP